MSEDWRWKPVVVTGGLGFIGSSLALRLVEAGARVTVIDLPAPDRAGDLHNIAAAAGSIDLIEADLCTPGPWRDAVQNAFCVFHLAAQVSHPASMSDPARDLAQNCGSLLAVLDAVRSASQRARIVFTSTRQVYGRATALPLAESHPLRPTDINGVHKVAAEEYLRIAAAVHGIRSTTLRLANTYGPRMDLRNPGRGVLNVFLARALRGETLTVFGDGSQRRDINFIDDVVDALLRAALTDAPGPFHLGGSRPVALREFLAVLSDLLPIEIEHRPFPPELAAIDIGDSHCDFSRFHRATGWSPATSLSSGLRTTMHWFQSLAFASRATET